MLVSQTNPVGVEFCEHFLLFQYICMASGHMRENTLQIKYLPVASKTSSSSCEVCFWVLFLTSLKLRYLISLLSFSCKRYNVRFSSPSLASGLVLRFGHLFYSSASIVNRGHNATSQNNYLNRSLIIRTRWD